jgi:abhydrolase domain-containing protein 17
VFLFVMKFITYGIYILIGYAVLVLFSQLVVNSQMFFPPPSTYQALPGLIYLKTSDQKKIAAVYWKNPKAKYTLLYSHGNAEDLGALFPHLVALKDLGFSILAYDYHGYGLSEGQPTEKNLYRDINAAYLFLTKTQNIPSDQIILYGSSIGSGPTIDLAAREPVGGIILQSPFLSAFRTLTYWPILPFDRFNNARKVKDIQVPILLIHGRQDEVIPIWHGKKLITLFKYPEKVQSIFIPKASHNNLIAIAGSRYWHAITNFINQLPKWENKVSE